MDWVRVELSRSLPYAEGEGRLLAAFLRAFFASGGPEDMGLFRPRRRDPAAPEEYLLSPKAAARCPELVAAFDGTPCPVPHRSTVAMVAGHLSSRDLLVG